MTEPKYDEDAVNLGYLKKVIFDTEENIEDTYKNVSRHYASKPNTPYYKGDTWIDGNIVYTCINSREIGLYTDSDWTTESGAKQEAESKNKTYLTQPSNYSVGDMWILQSDNDHKAGKKGEILISSAGRKEYNADDWTNMLGYGTIKSINEVAEDLNNAINRIGNVEEAIEDGIIITFYQNAVPEAKHVGDLWYVTGELEGYIKGKIYRYDGTNWVVLNDPAIQEAFDEANEARLVADGKIQSFYSDTEPTENMGVGDLWIDLANNNQLYRYNGTNWVAVYDTRINDLVTSVDSVTERVTTIETDLGEIDLKVQENTTTITTIEGNVNNITNTQGEAEGKNIHIEDSAEEPFVDVELYGESTQEGTPTPDSPSEIENVEGKNKFDYESAINVENLTYDNTYAFFEIKNIKPNTAYTISNLQLTDLTNLGYSVYAGLTIGNTYSTGPGKAFYSCIYNNVYKNGIGVVTGYSGTKANGGKLYFCIATTNTNKELAYERFIKICSMVFDKAQIEEGTATPYVPYNSLEFRVEGKNKLKGLSTPLTDSDYWYSVNSNYFEALEDGWGKFSYDNTSGTSTVFINSQVKLNAINLKPNTQYTIITEFRNSTVSENAGAFFTVTSGNATDVWQAAKTVGYSYINQGKIVKLTATTKEDFTGITTGLATYLRLGAGTSGTVEARISVIEGDYDTTDFEYEPYKSQVAYFPLAEGKKLMEGSYLADDGIHHNFKEGLANGTSTTFEDAKENGKFYCNKKASGNLEGKTIAFDTEVTDAIVQYELAEPETVPYTEEQQEAWEKIKAMYTYKNITNITSDAYAKIIYMRDNGLDVYETKQNAEKNYTETTKKLAEQKMTVDGIVSEVLETKSNINTMNNNLTELNETVASTKLKVDEYEIKFEETTKTINEELKENSETIKSMSYTFNTDELSIAKSDDPVNAKINNSGMRVYSYNDLKAIFNDKGTGIQKLIVVGSAQLGNLQTVKATDENGEACTDFHHLVSNIQELTDLEV